MLRFDGKHDPVANSYRVSFLDMQGAKDSPDGAGPYPLTIVHFGDQAPHRYHNSFGARPGVPIVILLNNRAFSGKLPLGHHVFPSCGRRRCARFAPGAGGVQSFSRAGFFAVTAKRPPELSYPSYGCFFLPLFDIYFDFSALNGEVCQD